jgi:WhiB family redox-sensing transcriptional regulator
VASSIQQGALSWADGALCVGKTEIFFGQLKEKPTVRARRERQAIAICEQCPAIYKCRQFARENSELGVWGGETEDERFRAGFLRNPDVSRRNKQKDRRASAKL